MKWPLAILAEIYDDTESDVGVAAKKEQARARAADLAPVIAEIRRAGIGTFGGLARALTARGVPTLSGRGRWDPSTVRRMLAPGA